MAPTGTNTVKSAAATPSASNSSMAHAPFLKNLAANGSWKRKSRPDSD